MSTNDVVKSINDYNMMNDYTVHVMLRDYMLVSPEAVRTNPEILDFARRSVLERFQNHVANMTVDDIRITAPISEVFDD